MSTRDFSKKILQLVDFPEVGIIKRLCPNKSSQKILGGGGGIEPLTVTFSYNNNNNNNNTLTEMSLACYAHLCSYAACMLHTCCTRITLFLLMCRKVATCQILDMRQTSVQCVQCLAF